MEINNELLAKAKEAKTADELKALAEANGEEMTEESAKAYFEKLHPQNGEIADDELDNVTGGCGGGYDAGKPKPRYSVGQEVVYTHTWLPNGQPVTGNGIVKKRYYEDGMWYYVLKVYGEERTVAERLIQW